MSSIIYTEAFVDDIDRIADFLQEKNPVSAQNLFKLLKEKLSLLASLPMAFPSFGEYRLYHLPFGSSGYVVLYDYDEQQDALLLWRMKHYHEAGF